MTHSDQFFGNEDAVRIEMESKRLSEATYRSDKASSPSAQGDTTLSQNQAQNRANFKTLAKIPEEEKIEIIKTRLKVYF